MNKVSSSNPDSETQTSRLKKNLKATSKLEKYLQKKKIYKIKICTKICNIHLATQAACIPLPMHTGFLLI